MRGLFGGLFCGRKQSEQFTEGLRYSVFWQLTEKLSVTDAPIQVLHLVGENNTLDFALRGYRNLEGIVLDLACDWTQDRETDFTVVFLGREH
jgi:hypothetical protein